MIDTLRKTEPFGQHRKGAEKRHSRAAHAHRLLTLGALMLLASCSVIPRPAAPPPPPPPTATALPVDIQRHRVALLVPLAGANAGAGEALANAANMAILDANAGNLRITTYDTSTGAPAAAARAVADGNQLILGPLLPDDVLAVARTAQGAHIPVISFASDTSLAGGDIFVMGNIPAQAIERVVRNARAGGGSRFAALIPVGSYGTRASIAMLAAVRASGGTVIGMESYERSATSILAAARRLRLHGAYDAVLIADSPRVAALAAPVVERASPRPRLLGTELWSGDAAVAHTPALAGARFAALDDARFHSFAERYRARFGTAPYRIATLGYDAVLLTLRIAREWRNDAPFPTARLYDQGGFDGADGVFRFHSDGVVERALEVREARGGGVSVVSAAPRAFAQ